MKLIIIVLLSLFSGSSVFAQLHIYGRVLDQITDEPVEGAVIQYSGATVVSAKDGVYQLHIRDEEQDVTVSAIGYALQSVQVTKATGEIRLQRVPINLKDVLIKSGSPNSFAATISKLDLNHRPVNSAQDFLRMMPGLFIAQHQGGGKAEQIFLRGFDVDHGTDVQITVDGMPVNMVSHAHGQGYADLHFVIPELVKTIDYGKGSYYTDKGNFNTAGYVELQTRNSLEKNMVQLEAGQFQTYRGLVMMNLLPKENKKQNAYIASEFIYSDGPFISPQKFNRFNIWGKYHLHLNDRTKLFTTVNLFNSRWNASGQVPDRAVKDGTIDRFGAIDDTESGYTGRFNINTKLVQRTKNNNLLEHQVFYSRYNFNLFSNFTFFLNDPVNGDQIKQSEFRNLLGYQSKYKFSRNNNGFDFNTTLGTGIRYDATTQSELSSTLNKKTVQNRIKLGNIRETNAFVYADEKIEKGKWLFNLGVRIDYFHFGYQDELNASLPSQGKAIISPKFNIQYTASDVLQVYFKNGKGFHSNDTRVVLPQSGRKILPASYGTDLGFIWKPFPTLLINTAFWHLFLQQEFVYVGDAGIVEPGGKTRRHGVDISARYQLSKNLFADVNLNLANARSIEAAKTENYIPLAPTFTSTGGLTYQNQTGWSASIRYRAIKNRAANEDYSITAKGYFVTDAHISYTHNNYTIGASVENLLNTKWNEAQFATTSRLRNELESVTELNYTPGTPIFLKLKMALTF